MAYQYVKDRLLSSHRLNSYQTVFSPGSESELFGAYLWGCNLVGALYPLASHVEVALRNSVDTALTRHFGNFWWSSSTGALNYKSYVRGQLPPATVKKVRDKFSEATLAYKKAESEKTGRPTSTIIPTHEGVISKTLFFTWEGILDDEFSGRGLIWPTYLGRVFAGNWPSTSANTTRRQAQDLVKVVRDFRNRLSHHEPAWKRFNVNSSKDAFGLLEEKIARMESLLKLIHPSAFDVVDRAGFFEAARYASSRGALEQAQKLTKAKRVRSVDDFSLLIYEVNKNKKTSLARFHPRRGKSIDFIVSPHRQISR